MNKYGHRGMHRRHRGGGGDKRWFGLILLLIGSVLLLRKFDLLYFNWHDMWPWILVFVGTMIGVKSKFRNNASWILILIGVAHLLPVFTIFGVASTALAIPAAFILVGILIILNPSKKKRWDARCDNNMKTVTNSDSTINIDVTFGGHKEIITSKDFRGGTVSTTFGGTELNLINADTTQETIELNLRVSFGGVELAVPSHWEIRNEISNTLGNVEDERNIQTSPGEKKVILVLTGSCSFGNIEIKSY
ncbi:MAG: hypothetical protein H6551_04065 [Chitinophagales bacterium]|nr:hypothetical protein [Chitinophagaceae bacterium]MCB9064298.1 hypothetical protein [Chitinophagales bacterium]